MKNIIKKLLRENLNVDMESLPFPTELTLEYLMKRIPTLKEFKLLYKNEDEYRLIYERSFTDLVFSVPSSKSKVFNMNRGVYLTIDFIVYKSDFIRSADSGEYLSEYHIINKPHLILDRDEIEAAVSKHNIKKDDFLNFMHFGMLEQLIEKSGTGNYKITVPRGSDLPKEKIDSLVNEINKIHYFYEDAIGDTLGQKIF